MKSAVFAENMQPCAAVEPKILAILTSVLRLGCEFGIDFEIALGMRRHLQKLYGFSQPPSLAQVTGLSSDLLIVALANIALHYSTHMRDLEQWLDFLIDFYFQESGNELPPADSVPTDNTSEFQLVSSSKSKENVGTNDNDTTIVVQVETEEKIEGEANECVTSSPKSGSIEESDEKKQLLDTREEKDDEECSSPSSSECLSGARTPQEDDHIIKQQMAAALESYRRQKRLQTRIINTVEPKSSRITKVFHTKKNNKKMNRFIFVFINLFLLSQVTPEIISKILLLSAIRLLSRLDKNVQNSFQIVWNIMSRINLHCSDQQMRKAHEEFEQLFPLYSFESDSCQDTVCP
jgi:hypothetical protein